MAASDLSDGVWEQILRCGNLSAKDVNAFGRTNKRYRGVTNSNRLWRHKFTQRWSIDCVYQPDASTNWYSTYRDRWLCIGHVSLNLTQLSQTFVRRETLIVPYTCFESLYEAENEEQMQRKIRLVIDQLRILIGDGDCTQNLTTKFYGGQALSYLVREMLRPQIGTWISQNAPLMEIGAWLLAQWFQPEKAVKLEDIRDELETLAQQTRDLLKLKHPRHPIFDLQDGVDIEGLPRSLFPPPHCRQVLQSLCDVFVQKNLVGDTFDDQNDEWQRCCIDVVLSTGHGRPISLCIIFHSIALRLGVKTELVCMPGRFLLKFMEHPDLTGGQQFTYLDVWDRCRWMDEEQVWGIYMRIMRQNNRDNTMLNDTPPTKVVVRMCNNIRQYGLDLPRRDLRLVCSAMELSQQLMPGDNEIRFHVARLYVDYFDTNADLALKLLDNVREPSGGNSCPFLLQVATIREKARMSLAECGLFGAEKKLDGSRRRAEHKHVLHSTGQIMRHKKFDYTCVISGWDPVCLASRVWQIQMGVHKLPRAHKQPFYHVLVNDGSNRYAADENLILEPNPAPIDHEEVGKFFQKFCGNYYEMNPEKAVAYPDDSEATVSYVNRCCYLPFVGWFWISLKKNLRIVVETFSTTYHTTSSYHKRWDRLTRGKLLTFSPRAIEPQLARLNLVEITELKLEFSQAYEDAECRSLLAAIFSSCDKIHKLHLVMVPNCGNFQLRDGDLPVLQTIMERFRWRWFSEISIRANCWHNLMYLSRFALHGTPKLKHLTLEPHDTTKCQLLNIHELKMPLVLDLFRNLLLKKHKIKGNLVLRWNIVSDAQVVYQWLKDYQGCIGNVEKVLNEDGDVVIEWNNGTFGLTVAFASIKS